MRMIKHAGGGWQLKKMLERKVLTVLRNTTKVCSLL